LEARPQDPETLDTGPSVSTSRADLPAQAFPNQYAPSPSTHAKLVLEPYRFEISPSSNFPGLSIELDLTYGMYYPAHDLVQDRPGESLKRGFWRLFGLLSDLHNLLQRLDSNGDDSKGEIVDDAVNRH
jgi:hypothetical protein